MCAGRNTRVYERRVERVAAWLLVIVCFNGPYAFLSIYPEFCRGYKSQEKVCDAGLSLVDES